VQACGNCHGPAGLGAPPAYPYLAGQNAAYLAAALTQWRNGERDTDPSGQMPHVAKAMREADLPIAAAWFAAQPPPPSKAKPVEAPSAGSRDAATSGAPPGPTSGSGTEQGAGTSGGSQGPGPSSPAPSQPDPSTSKETP
jgi:hypothetical protein